LRSKQKQARMSCLGTHLVERVRVEQLCAQLNATLIVASSEAHLREEQGIRARHCA
jgi:hypothetical protein